ncbi:MAG: hypothetical protein CMJ89_14770 [Planctomycetes bacterium]|jgi:ribosomal protein S1|nr:hypothetical protein [Planctomycetota bacterium]
MNFKNENRMQALRDELESELDPELVPADGSSLYPAMVAGTSGSDVILELGPRVQGACPLAEFDAPPENGSRLRVALRGQEEGLWLFSIREARALTAWDDMEVGSLVKGTVIAVIKGGLELRIGPLRGFLPASQVALHHVEDLMQYGDQSLVCEVIELDRGKKRVVVSRRAVLEAERDQHREEAMGELAPGSVRRGKVARMESYGAFVDLGGGIEGLLHVSNLSHRRVEHPNEMLKIGQDVEVQILSVEEGGKRIGLGRKQLEADPWENALERFHEDKVVEGKVRRIANFGAFVELEPGLEGLLHVSQLGPGRIHHANEVVKPGDDVSVRILTIDAPAQRISLSRLDPRGALLGSEEAAGSEEIEEILNTKESLGTNLGALFKKALGEKG